MRRIFTFLLGVTLVITSASVALAAEAGELDPTFGVDGKATLSDPREVKDVMIQPDGKILIDGRDSSGDTSFRWLARFTGDGELDTTFGDGQGWMTVPWGYSAALDGATGRIVLDVQDGEGPTAAAIDSYGLFVLDIDGAVDGSFGTSGRVSSGSGTAIHLAVQPDGKILQAGSLWRGEAAGVGAAGTAGGAGRTETTLTRFDAAGHPDPTFGTNGIVTLPTSGGAGFSTWWPIDGHWAHGGWELTSFAVQPETGRILLAGRRLNGGQPFVVALTNGGLPDPTFGSGGVVAVGAPEGSYQNRSPAEIVTSSDGTLHVVTSIKKKWINPFHYSVVRLNADGQRDTSYGVEGEIGFDSYNTMTGAGGDREGRFLLAMRSELYRFTPGGNPDPTFGDGGIVTWTPTYLSSTGFTGVALAIDEADRAVMAGWSPDGSECRTSVCGPVTLVRRLSQRVDEEVTVEQGMISGTVASPSGTGISGATVDCEQAQAITDYAGEYLIGGLYEGSYHCTASAAGYRSARAHVTVIAGQTTLADFTLQPSKK